MNQKSRPTSASFLSERTVSDKARRRVMHPNDAGELIDALKWAVAEADRLGKMVNAAGLAISDVSITLPSDTSHFIRVAVSGTDGAS